MNALKGKRIVSLALNLPGPAALMRCRAMGADCLKIEPPAGDPMQHYNPALYDHLHKGIAASRLNLKQADDYARLLGELGSADLLLCSFRPSALVKLGLDWPSLTHRLPQPARLSQVSIVGARGERAEEAGHDLTYMVEAKLVAGTQLPQTLYADMGGALLVVEAILAAMLAPSPSFTEVALADAAQFLALPLTYQLTGAGTLLGGAHAGYAVYPCRDGAIALAALEPHFAARLAKLAGLDASEPLDMRSPAAHAAVAQWALLLTCEQALQLATTHDLPLQVLRS